MTKGKFILNQRLLGVAERTGNFITKHLVTIAMVIIIMGLAVATYGERKENEAHKIKIQNSDKYIEQLEKQKIELEAKLKNKNDTETQQQLNEIKKNIEDALKQARAKKQIRFASASTAVPQAGILPPLQPQIPPEQSTVIAYGKQVNDQLFGAGQWPALYELLKRESGWQVGRVNHTSLACGLGQSLPCSKMYGTMPATHYVGGKLFIVNPDYKREVDWTLNYIKGRYGTPANALAFHNGHNWY